MKKWRTYLSIFLVAIATTIIRNYFYQSKNNNQKTELVEIQVDSLYSIKVPTYLKKTDKLNIMASYQGVNEEKHAYLIVIDDLNTSRLSLENYRVFVENKFKNGANEAKFTNRKKLKVDKFEALQFNLEGKINNEKTYGLMTIIEGTLDFYQIFSWTSMKNNESYFSEMEQVARSFKELKY